jgi:hypothetical protein
MQLVRRLVVVKSSPIKKLQQQASWQERRVVSQAPRVSAAVGVE